jgi:isoaspartyl peptidase/L-asparaginase-like protein (Ntn-hydrolase superfamily)
VECDASIMDGSTGCFVALGAIQGACINLGIRTGSFIN